MSHRRLLRWAVSPSVSALLRGRGGSHPAQFHGAVLAVCASCGEEAEVPPVSARATGTSLATTVTRTSTTSGQHCLLRRAWLPRLAARRRPIRRARSESCRLENSHDTDGYELWHLLLSSHRELHGYTKLRYGGIVTPPVPHPPRLICSPSYNLFCRGGTIIGLARSPRRHVPKASSAL